MSEFWQELIINWGGNAVLGALVVYLGKIYLERTNRNEQATIDTVARDQQAKIDERLKHIEQYQENRLTRNDYFHQISQQTYQKLFDKKVEVYSDLFTLVIEIESEYPYMPNSVAEKVLTDQEIGIEEILLSARGKFVYDKYVKLNSIFNKNLSLLSPVLVDQYLIWKSKIKPELDIIREKDLVRTSDIINKLDDNLEFASNSELLGERIKADKKMYTHVTYLKKVIVYQNNLDGFKLIVKQIENEIKALNQRIDGFYNLFETEKTPSVNLQDTP